MSDNILIRYRQAQTISQGQLTDKLVMNDTVFPHWVQNSHCFWYKRTIKEGKEFRFVDADAATNVPAFDHQVLSRALTDVSGETVDHRQLPFPYIAISLEPFIIFFRAFDKHWTFDPVNNQLEEVIKDQQDNLSLGVEKNEMFFYQYESKQQTLPSPDGKKEVFIRGHNVWLHDRLSGDIQALTHDGTEDYGYSGGLAGADAAVQALWSPDSNSLFTVQLDTRQVASRPFINYAPQQGDLLPQVTPTKMAYPGDDHVETYRLVIINVATGQVQAVDYPSLPLMQNGSGFFGFFNGKPLGWWSLDSQRAFFVEVTRASKNVRVVELNPHTGATKVLFEETSDTFINLSSSVMEVPQFLPLPESNELIWFSERSGAAHLYLYDLNTGALKHPITQGPWLARRILHYDAKKREILLQTMGRDDTVSPYYQDICVVNIDSGALTPLVPNDFEYRVTDRFNSFAAGEFILRGLESDDINGVSPCGQYIVTTRSRVDTVPISVLIDRQGRELLTIETADVSGLPSGWQWPEPVKLTGADGETDIYGVIFRPLDFSPDQSYPVIDYSCSQRTISSLPQGSFMNSVFLGIDYLQAASYAALGFVVVAIEGRGTPLRGKAFQDHHYGDHAYVNDFDDRIAGMRQLAKRYAYMDLERVGITGHENQTNNIYSLLKHPYFYKVAILNCLFDPRFNMAAIGETADNTCDKTTVPKTGYPEDCVESFKGKLLLIQGMLSFATPSGTFRLVEALQKSNKDFDMLCLPNLIHAMSSYTIRREWDYLVTHLQGIDPPQEFQLKTGLDFLDEITQ